MGNPNISEKKYALKRSRKRAVEQDTSINAMQRILYISDTAESGRGGRTWSRQELHERPGIAKRNNDMAK